MTFLRLRPSPLLLAAGTLFLLAGCGSDGDEADSTPTTATAVQSTVAASPTTAGPTVPPPSFAPEDEELCRAAVRIAAGDAELQDQLGAAVAESIQTGEIDAFAQLLAELRTGGTIDGVAEAFSDLEAAAPAEQQEAVRAFGEFTTATFADLEDINSVEELREWADGLTSDPETIAIQDSARTVNDLVQTRCGISLTS